MTVTLELTAILLSLVALAVTMLGFFASLWFYRDGKETQQLVNGLLAKVEARVEVIGTQMGDILRDTFKYAMGRPEDQVRAQTSESTPSPGPDYPVALLEKELREGSPPGQTLWDLFTLRGLRFTNVNALDGQLFFHQGVDQGFNLFNGHGPRVVYYGHFHELEPVQVVARVRMLIGRLDGMRRHLSEVPKDPNRDRLLEYLEATEVIVLIPSDVGAERVQERIEQFKPEDWKVPVTAWTRADLDQEYRSELERMQP